MFQKIGGLQQPLPALDNKLVKLVNLMSSKHLSNLIALSAVYSNLFRNRNNRNVPYRRRRGLCTFLAVRPENESVQAA